LRRNRAQFNLQFDGREEAPGKTSPPGFACRQLRMIRRNISEPRAIPQSGIETQMHRKSDARQRPIDAL
jgi:hypothetical protein